MNTRFYQTLFMGSLAAAVLLASLGTSTVNMALPSIAKDFGVSFAEAKWILLAYLIANTIFSLVVGQLGDSLGRKKILLFGALLFLAGSFMGALSSTLSILIIARTVQGIGAAALIVLPLAFISEKLPQNQSGRAIGFLASMSAVGTASGPSAGGFIIVESGWRSLFCLMFFISALVSVFSLKFLPNDEKKPISALRKISSIETAKSFAHDSHILISLFSNLSVSAVMMTTLIVGPFFLTHQLNLGAAAVGLLMSVGPMTSILSGLFSGYLVDRYGAPVVVKWGLIQLLVGSLSFGIAPLVFGTGGFAVSALLLSLGYQLFQSANSKNLIERVPPENKGAISGALNLSRNLGLITGAWVMGFIFESQGLSITFFVAAILIIFLIVIRFKNQQRSAYEAELAREVY